MNTRRSSSFFRVCIPPTPHPPLLVKEKSDLHERPPNDSTKRNKPFFFSYERRFDVGLIFGVVRFRDLEKSGLFVFAVV